MEGREVVSDPRRAISVVREEIAGLPAVIRDQIATVWPAVRALLDDLPIETIPGVVLTGCGDSYFAGLAARRAFEHYSGLPARAIGALDLARYDVDTLPPGTLVLAVSYSGQVARTVEAARNAAYVSATVVAITGHPERRLAATAGRVLPLAIPSPGYSLGTSTYAGLLLALYLLAIGLGQRRGVLTADRAQSLVDELRAMAVPVEGAIAASSDSLRDYAARLASDGTETVLFLGAGPNEASALFGAAKLFEGAQLNGVAQNTEEWAHAQYFISGPASRTVLLAPRGRSLDRAIEIATEMRFIGTPFLVITDDAPDRWRALTPEVVALPAGGPEMFSPLLLTVPLSLLGYELAVARGKQSYNFASPEHEREHYQTLHESAFRDLSTLPRREP